MSWNKSHLGGIFVGFMIKIIREIKRELTINYELILINQQHNEMPENFWSVGGELRKLLKVPARRME